MMMILAVIGFVAVLSVAMIIDNTESGWAVITALLILSLLTPEVFPSTLAYINGISPWQYITSHLWTFGQYVVEYMMAGVVYIWIRWWFFVRAAAAYYKETLVEGDAYHTKFSSRYGTSTTPLRVAEFKNRITGWGLYWPFSLLALIIDAPLKKFFNFVYNLIRNSLQAMSDNAFKDINTRANK